MVLVFKYFVLFLVFVIVHSTPSTNECINESATDYLSTSDGGIAGEIDENPNRLDNIIEIEFLNELKSEEPSEESIKSNDESIRQEYIIFEQGFNHEAKFQSDVSEEYLDLVHDRRPLADIFINFFWKKLKPAVQAVNLSILNQIDNISKQCRGPCVWITRTSQILFPGTSNENANKYLGFQQMKDKSSLHSSIAEYAQLVFAKIQAIQCNIPLVPLADISKIDTSIENVELEDQICFGLIRNAFSRALDLVVSSLEKISIPGDSHAIERYADKVKRDFVNRENRARGRGLPLLN